MFGNTRYKSNQKQVEINYRQEEKKILDSVLGPDVYDKRIRPSGLNSTGGRGSVPQISV
jgi:anionic glutamate receptor